MNLQPCNIPRPGLALGRYPERHSSPPNRLDDLCNQVTQRLVSRWTYRSSQFDQVITRIDRAGQPLIDITDDALIVLVRDLRPLLVRAGWCEELAVQAFAVVREMSDRTLGMRHFESQLLGGWVMYHGQLAEMQTGEGKTLTATLPAATAALAGIPVHIITSNDYLAARDAAAMRPLFERLGLTVGVISQDLDVDARRAAYACHVTYCTNKQVAFDYLRDRVIRGTSFSKTGLDLEPMKGRSSMCKRLMLRGLCFAIVDEADSVLVDEARTPLVLSRPLEDDASMHAIYWQALELAGGLKRGADFLVNKTEDEIVLTPCGSVRLAELAKQAEQSNPVWRAIKQREELVRQALSALHVYKRDRHYVVCNNIVQIVDGNTGRLMADRSWQAGLHQMIECKESCEPSGHKETLARMSYQCFFRHYLKLAGMTGTAHEVEREVGTVYGLNVVRIPPHRPPRRIALPERVFLCADDASAAVVTSARHQLERGRPVLIGTRSVLKSEFFAQLLEEAGLDTQVLNACQDANEANIIAQAGKPGQITVATNMAGRGTDILLGSDVKHSGGLHIILTERNDSARVDRQLMGRCGRQGDPGSYQCFSSLEDELPRLHGDAMALRWLALISRNNTRELPVWLGSWILDRAQRRLERHHEQIRRQVDRAERDLNDVLSFTGGTP